MALPLHWSHYTVTTAAVARLWWQADYPECVVCCTIVIPAINISGQWSRWWPGHRHNDHCRAGENVSMESLCEAPLPDLVSSRSKYLMNLNNFSALENVSPLIRARGGDWYITLSHTVFLLTDVATVTQWSQGQTLALLLWRLLGLKYTFIYCIHASILVQAEEYGLQAFGNQILLLSYYHTGTAVICVCTVPRNLFCSSIWPKMLLGVPLESGSGL